MKFPTKNLRSNIAIFRENGVECTSQSRERHIRKTQSNVSQFIVFLANFHDTVIVNVLLDFYDGFISSLAEFYDFLKVGV